MKRTRAEQIVENFIRREVRKSLKESSRENEIRDSLSNILQSYRLTSIVRVNLIDELADYILELLGENNDNRNDPSNYGM